MGTFMQCRKYTNNATLCVPWQKYLLIPTKKEKLLQISFISFQQPYKLPFQVKVDPTLCIERVDILCYILYCLSPRELQLANPI